MTFFRIAFVCVLLASPVAAAGPPLVDGTLPAMTLPAPTTPESRRYLGIDEAETFTIPGIDADVVIIEVFSMYCPHCQREAPQVNTLYQLMADHPERGDRLKLIGIGAGNSSFEVDYFRKTYDVPFPLIPDGDFVLHKALGEVRTPYFLAVRLFPDGTHRVIYSKLGAFENPASFLDLILSRSGLQ